MSPLLPCWLLHKRSATLCNHCVTLWWLSQATNVAACQFFYFHISFSFFFSVISSKPVSLILINLCSVLFFSLLFFFLFSFVLIVFFVPSVCSLFIVLFVPSVCYFTIYRPKTQIHSLFSLPLVSHGILFYYLLRSLDQ